jgi:predicted TIM-barrel fold metal-dependent hydrolase
MKIILNEPRIIDAHLHLYQSQKNGLQAKKGYEIWEYGSWDKVQFSSYYGDLNDTLKAIDEAGATHAVVVNMCSSSDYKMSVDKSTMGEILKASNTWVCEKAKKHSQLVPFIGVDPKILSVKDMGDHIREMVDIYNAKGIKVHPVVQRFYLHDKRMLPILKICIDLGLPIITHSGPSRDDESYSEPKVFDTILKKFPQLRLVLAHMGGGTWRQLKDIANVYPNVYYDISEIIMWTGAPNAPTDHELSQLILDVGSERVMMGSDFPWYDIDYTVERVMKLPLISEKQKKAMLGYNATQILNI